MKDAEFASNAAMVRLTRWDHCICERLYRVEWSPAFRQVCRWASRLGDGVIWYALIVALPVVYGFEAIGVSVNMLVTGALCLAVYKLLKQRTGRPRPFAVLTRVQAATDPLDQFSFPSGHTLHAVAFSITVVSYFPELAVLVAPLVVLIAISRVVLGLHYPSDVLAGALIGGVLAESVLLLWQ